MKLYVKIPAAGSLTIQGMEFVASNPPSTITEIGDGEVDADTSLVDAMTEEGKPAGEVTSEEAVADELTLCVEDAVEVVASDVVDNVLLELAIAWEVGDAISVDLDMAGLEISIEGTATVVVLVETAVEEDVEEGTIELIPMEVSVLVIISDDVLVMAVDFMDITGEDGSASEVTT